MKQKQNTRTDLQEGRNDRMRSNLAMRLAPIRRCYFSTEILASTGRAKMDDNEVSRLLNEYEQTEKTIIAEATEVDFVEYLKDISHSSPEWYTTAILSEYFNTRMNRETAEKEASEYHSRLLRYLEQIATEEEYFAVLYSHRDLMEADLSESGVIPFCVEVEGPSGTEVVKDEETTFEDLIEAYPQLIEGAPKYEDSLKYTATGAEKLSQAIAKMKMDVCQYRIFY